MIFWLVKIKTNNFSAISRADERNIVVDDIYENEYKQKKKFTRRDSLSSNLLVSDETANKIFKISYSVN